jgi:hypothetical protein
MGMNKKLIALNFYHLGVKDSGNGRSIMIKRLTMCGSTIRVQLSNDEWGFIVQNKNEDYLMDGTYWADMSVSISPEQKLVSNKIAMENIQ